MDDFFHGGMAPIDLSTSVERLMCAVWNTGTLAHWLMLQCVGVTGSQGEGELMSRSAASGYADALAGQGESPSTWR